jgi:hypothetical protein
MSSRKNSQYKKNSSTKDPKWYSKEEIQELANTGKKFLKKTLATGADALKEAKGHLPKDAKEFIAMGKRELLKGITQQALKNIVIFSVEKMFSTARQYRLELSFRIRKNDDEKPQKKSRE